MKITYRNNWENDEYFIDGKKVKELIRVSFDGKEYDATARNVSVSYSDMGHTYRSESTHFFIKEKVLGVDISIDLNQIVPKNPKIRASIYTLVDE